MATQGKNAAYRQLRPLQGDLSSDVKYWNEDAARRRREDRIDDQIEYRRAEKAKQDKKDLYDKYVKPLNNYDTKSTSLNEINGRLLQQATEQYGPLIETLESETASNEEKLKAQLKLQTLNQLPENLKSVTDFYTNQHNSYLTGLENGTIWKDEAYEKAFANGFENIQMGLDDKGLPTVAFIDRDGDGIADKINGDVLDVQSFEQIKKGLPTFNFQKKFNIEGYINEFSNPKTGLGVRERTTDTGFTKNTVKGIDPKNLNFATDKLFNQPGVTESALREYGLEYSEDNIFKIKEDFKKSVLAKSNSSNVTDVDASARTSAAREARLNRESKSKEAKLTEPSKPSDDIWDLKATNVNPEKVNSLGVQGVQLPTVKGRDGAIYSNVDVHNITFNEEGKMVIDASSTIEKSVSKLDYSKYEEEIENATTPEEKSKAEEALEIAKLNKSGVKVTLPPKKVRGSTIIAEEEAKSIAKQLNKTLEELKVSSFKDEVPKTKRTIEGF